MTVPVQFYFSDHLLLCCLTDVKSLNQQDKNSVNRNISHQHTTIYRVVLKWVYTFPCYHPQDCFLFSTCLLCYLLFCTSCAASCLPYLRHDFYSFMLSSFILYFKLHFSLYSFHLRSASSLISDFPPLTFFQHSLPRYLLHLSPSPP